VERKVNLDLSDATKRTPLSWAAGNGFADIAKYLIEQGAGLNIHEAGSRELGMLAPELIDNLEAMAVLRNRYQHVADGEVKGWTALHWALENNHQETAILLVEKSANILAADCWGPCSLSVAIVKCQEAVPQAMINKNKEAFKRGTFWRQWTALHLAAVHRSVPMMQLVLPEAADVSLREGSGKTAMELASIGLQAMVGSENWTPNMERAGDAIKLLHAHGASIGPGGPHSSTPLHCASAFGQLEAAEALLESGADVHAKNKFGWTPLLGASAHGETAVARLLISKGADVNATENNGLSALTVACGNKHVDMMQLLLEAGADSSGVKEKDRKRALELGLDLEKGSVVSTSKPGLEVDDEEPTLQSEEPGGRRGLVVEVSVHCLPVEYING
jgi:ankyrin repeat protein